MTKIIKDKQHAISTTQTMLRILLEELNKNDQKDFEIWIAANHLKDILEKQQEEFYKNYIDKI